jgi:prepilin-type N-terminal cleavage/methylation domain-containing protein
MRCKKDKKINEGFTLLETLTALSVLSLAVIGPLTLASYAIHLAGFSQNQIGAFYLAQEAMEYIKNRRDNNALTGESNWLKDMAPSGSGSGLCRNPKGCIVDVPNNNVQSCSPSECPKIKYDAVTGFYNYVSGTETTFIREVKLDYVSNYEEKISIIVSWQESFGQRSLTLEENIFDWP